MTSLQQVDGRRGLLLTLAFAGMVLVAAALLIARVTLGNQATLGGADPGRTPAPDFTLTDQRGQTASLGDFHSKAVAPTLIYINCPDDDASDGSEEEDWDDLGRHQPGNCNPLSSELEDEDDAGNVVQRIAEVGDELSQPKGEVTWTAHDVEVCAPHAAQPGANGLSGNVNHRFV